MGEVAKPWGFEPCPQLFVTIDFVPNIAIFYYILWQVWSGEGQSRMTVFWSCKIGSGLDRLIYILIWARWHKIASIQDDFEASPNPSCSHCWKGRWLASPWPWWPMQSARGGKEAGTGKATLFDELPCKEATSSLDCKGYQRRLFQKIISTVLPPVSRGRRATVPAMGGT